MEQTFESDHMIRIYYIFSYILVNIEKDRLLQKINPWFKKFLKTRKIIFNFGPTGLAL